MSAIWIVMLFRTNFLYLWKQLQCVYTLETVTVCVYNTFGNSDSVCSDCLFCYCESARSHLSFAHVLSCHLFINVVKYQTVHL